MRRITLLALLAAVMILVSGVAVFADDAAPALTWSGSLDTGFQLDYTTALQAKLWDAANGHPTDFTIDGALSGKLAGFKFEIVMNDATATVVAADAAYAWWTPFDMLTLTGGIGYGSVYGTPIEGWGATGAPGFQVKLTPVTGLAVGVVYPFAVTESNFDATNLQFAASYAIPDIATVGFGYNLATSYLAAGLSLTAVKGLTANFDFEDTFTTGGLMRVEGSFGYAVGSLSPSLWVFYQNTTTGIFGVKLSGSYAMGSVTPGAYFEYDDGGAMSMGANAAIAVEKQTVNVYVDYKTTGSALDLGFNFKMAF